MPADEEEAQPLAERVVKEAVTVGLETPMREPILEAIDEAGEGKKDPSRTVPMAGALLGLGAAAGYLLGARDVDIDAEDVPIDDFEEPDVIDDVVSGEESEDEEEFEEEVEEPSGGRLRPILVGLSLVAAVALIRRKLQSGDDEWEPIEEFETDDEDDEDDEFGGDFDDDFGTDEDEEEEADEDEEDEAEVEEEEAE